MKARDHSITERMLARRTSGCLRRQFALIVSMCSISRYVCRLEVVHRKGTNVGQTNIRDIRSGYPHIHKWMRHLYWNVPAFKDTTEFTHIKNHYTKSHTQVWFLGYLGSMEANNADQPSECYPFGTRAADFERGRGGSGCSVCVVVAEKVGVLRGYTRTQLWVTLIINL